MGGRGWRWGGGGVKGGGEMRVVEISRNQRPWNDLRVTLWE